MAQSKQHIERAIEWAKGKGDQAAVDELTQMLGNAEDEPTVSAEVNPPPPGGWPTESSVGGGLPPVSTDAQIDQQVEQRLNGPALAQQQDQPEPPKPFGEPTQDLMEDLTAIGDKQSAEKWKYAQEQFDADKELLADPANVPSKEETAEFLKMHQDAARPKAGMGGVNMNPASYAPIVNAENKQVLRDPETGKLRWAALPPEAVYGDKKTSVGKIVAGALGSTTIDMVGKRVEAIENEGIAVETMQRYVFSQLSEGEQSRVRNDLAREYGVDPSKITDELIAEKIPPHMLKNAVDANPNNAFIYDNILNEEDAGFLERLDRAGKKTAYGIKLAGSYVANALSPEWSGLDPIIDKKREELQQQPDTPPVFGRDTLAATYLDLWDSKARSSEPSASDVVSRVIAEPLRAFDPDLEFGKAISYGAEKIRENAYGEYYDRTKNPLLAPGTKFEDLLTAAPYTAEGTSSPLVDPAAFTIKAIEQLPYMGPGLIGGWGGGKVAQKMFGNATRSAGIESLEVTIKELEKLSRRRSIGGGLLGNAVGNSVVYDQAGSEVRQTVNEVPTDRLMENPEIKSLMAIGMSFEEAKQLLTHEAAGKAGRNAWALSSMVTAPTAGLSGLGGGGSLLNKNATARVVAAITISPVEEGFQEMVEGYASDAEIERIDPENPVLKDAGRWAERFVGGAAFAFATQAPLEGLSAIESQTPAGVDKEAQKAAQLTEKFLDARNARFALELKVTDPKYVAETSGLRRLEQLEKLQGLQLIEAEAILEMVGPVRAWMEANEASGREADLAMLASLERFANSQKTDIAVARNERMTARQMLEEHEALFEERAELQRNVNEKLIDLADIKRMQANLTTAQEQEPMTNQELSEMIDEGYIVTVGDSQRPIITPKGRRALKNLSRQRLSMEQSLNEGFTGQERRSAESLARREQINAMSEDDRESLLYQDALTDLPNKRAYEERGQEAASHTTIKVDSLEWINENMNFAAGDRVINHVVASINEAIETVGARDVEVYRTAGNQLSLTGASQVQAEEVMQVAAARMAKERITDGRTDVTPTVSWGVGETSAASVKAAAKARRTRVNEGIIADTSEEAKTAVRKEPGLFDKELNEENYSSYDLSYEDLSDLDIPNEYGAVSDQIEKGDVIEILTPEFAQFGTITRVQDMGGDRPRITVAIGNRRYRFNPEKNWLINHQMSSPDDMAYISGDPQMLLGENIPQVLEDVQIGLMGKGGDNWYADLATPDVTDKQTVNDFMSTQFSPNKQNLPKATRVEEMRSQEVKDKLFNNYQNIPEINLIHDLNDFRANHGDLYNQILSEVRAMGGNSLRGVKGYFDHNHPKAGVYIFTANIAAGSSMVGNGFEAAVQETIFHEIVGHYGVRGFFRNEAALREYMFDLVDSFNVGPNSLAKRMEADLNLYGATNKTDPDLGRKQLLGEEMLAYVVGKKMSGQLDVTPKQKTMIQKILDWMRNFLNRHFGVYGSKFVSTSDLQAEFWNDDRVQHLVAMSTDFARRGPPYKYAEIEAGRSPQMRDGDIFQFNLQQIFRTATRKLSNNDRKQLVKKYNGIENVPKELPIFPQQGSLNAYKIAANTVSKEGNPYGVKPIEMEMLGLSDSAPWNLFRDLTYGELFQLHARSQNRLQADVDRNWYQEYLPHNVRMELDAIYKAIDDLSVVGPIRPYEKENDKFLLDYADWDRRKLVSEPSYQAMQYRITEILDQKVDPKKTNINYDIFDAHVNGSKAFKVYAEAGKRHPKISRSQAAELLFGNGSTTGSWLDNAGGYNELSVEAQELIEDTIRLTESGGVDIGYNERTGEWMDYPRAYAGAWGGMTPAGAQLDEDYRVSLVKTEGGHYPKMPELAENHFDTNFMHIRHSVAEFIDAPSWAEYDAANVKYANRAWYLVEFQTDWSSHHRKGFESKDHRNSLHAKSEMHTEALSQAHERGLATTGRLVADMTTAAIEPMLAFLPDYESEKYSAPAGLILDGAAKNKYGRLFSELDPRDAQEIWHLEYIKHNEQIVQQLKDAEKMLMAYYADNDINFRKAAGSLDARMFDMLDQYAANIYVDEVRIAFKKARLAVQNYNNPASVVSAAVIKKAIAEAGVPQTISNDQARLRLPWVTDRIKPVLAMAFEGISTNYDNAINPVEQVLNQFQTQTVSTFSVPKVALENIFNGGYLKEFPTLDNYGNHKERDNAIVAAERIFTEYWNTNFIKTDVDDVAKATLIEGPLKFNFDIGTDNDNMIITVIGPERSQAIFDQYKAEAIESYVRNMVPLNVQSVREKKKQRPTNASHQIKKAADEWLESNDLREYLESEHSGTEYDPLEPTDHERSVLDNHSVQHRLDFISDIQDDIESFVRNNFSENTDWAAQFDLDEDNAEYQQRLADDGQDSADLWLAERRTEEEDNFDGSADFNEQVQFEIDARWESQLANSTRPYLFVSNLPTAWDEDGDVTESVEFKIVADGWNDNHYVWIDNDWKDYSPAPDHAWQSAEHLIPSYYAQEGIRPPAGAFMGPADAELDLDYDAEQKAAIAKAYPVPNLDILSSQASDNIKMKSQDSLDLVKSFKEMVRIDKKFGGRKGEERLEYYKKFFPDSPLHSDKLWRVTGLRYILADAVRRGFGAIVWEDGLATSQRGGGNIGTHDRVSTKRIEWSREVIEFNGAEEEIFVITTPLGELRAPVVVNKKNMIEVLGVHAAGVLRGQADGTWQPPSNAAKPIIKLPFTKEEITNKDHFIINEVTSSAAGRSTFSVHDTLQNHFVGYYATREEAETAIASEELQGDVRYELSRINDLSDRLTGETAAQERSREAAPTDPIGRRKSQGVIFAEDIGGTNIYLIPGNRVTEYSHTFPVPTLAGARSNYEKMNVDVWNKELKKYGAKIDFSYIKTNEPRRSYGKEGQVGKPSASADERFVSEYGSVEILATYTGFTIITEKKGPLSGTIFPTYQKALNYLEQTKSSHESTPEGLKVFTIVLNDQIKETFSKPISPFHYDKRLDEHLKTAKSKFRNTKTSLVDRARKFRARTRGSVQHEFLDGFYGWKMALEEADVSLRSYWAGRLSTGLEARMKAAFYYGYPVWDEDTTQSAGGRGLMDILGGIEGDPQMWGMYVAGLRGKELMLEGYDNLTPEEQAEVDRSVQDFDGDTAKEKIWNFVVARTKKNPGSYESLYVLNEAEKADLGEAGSRFYDATLWHFRDKGEPPRNEDGSIDKRFQKKRLLDWEKKVTRNGSVQDMRVGKLADEIIGEKYVTDQLGIHDDPSMTMWERKKRNMVWSLMDDPRIKDTNGNKLHPGTGKKIPGRYRKWEAAEYYGIETVAEAERIVEAVQNIALKKQAEIDEIHVGHHKHPVNNLVAQQGREKVFTLEELVSLVEIGGSYPSFERVRKEYVAFNKKVLDFAQEAGVINPETRKIWESEFYVPLYRIKDDRIGGPMAHSAGVTDLKKPIQRLTGGIPSDPVAQIVYYAQHQRRFIGEGKDEKAPKKKDIDAAIKAGYIEMAPLRAIKKTGKHVPQATVAGSEFLLQQGVNVGDILDNIMNNMASMIDASVKNHAALMGVDDLKDTGMIAKTPWKAKPKTAADKAQIDAAVLKALKVGGFNVKALPANMKEELAKLIDLEPPSGPGVISVLRDGRREYYKTDNMMLYESLTQVNRKNFGGNWAVLTAPKRFLTGSITLSPVFMATNVFRDSISASISSRDDFTPFVGAMKGFVSAITDDEIMRVMTSGGAAFEQGFITGGDEKATRKIIKKAMAKKAFLKTIVNDPKSIVKVGLAAGWGAYTKVGSSLENANRIAVYKAAAAAGKSKLQRLYESKDIMDFAMRGNNTAIQVLCATVPFMSARIQGVYRTGRGIKERPVASLLKGALYMSAALAVWAQFREDDRFKDLEEWDKAVYHHFWIGKDHYRLPRAFEVGALFTTIPEQWLEFLYSKEDDRGKTLLRQWAFMFGETFSMNPIPQTAKPLIEMAWNHNFFTGRSIVSPYMKRLPQDQFGAHSSETMRELARVLPDFNIGKGNIKSPKHLENLYRGYTGTLGQYLLSITDWMVRQAGDYPLPPTKTSSQHWATGRFMLGSDPPHRTKGQEEFYRMAEKLTSIQQSISFYEKTGIDDDRWDEILDTEAPYINIAEDFEDIREDVSALNREEMEIMYSDDDPDEKRKLINDITFDRNALFREAYELRPGGSGNPRDEPATTESLLKLIWEFGVNDSELAKKRLKEESPSTLEVLETVRNNMNRRQLESLAKASATNE